MKTVLALSAGALVGAAAVLALVSATPEVRATAARCRLQYGFLAQCDRPFYAVGDSARVSLAQFNFTPADAFGFSTQGGGFGCEYRVEILDAAGNVVYSPAVACTGVIVEKPLFSGTTLRATVSLPLLDSAGVLLPPGAYRFRAVAEFNGPSRAPGDFGASGGNAESLIPFRIE